MEANKTIPSVLLFQFISFLSIAAKIIYNINTTKLKDSIVVFNDTANSLLTYQNQYGDLVAAFNGDVNQITNHYKNNGINEGRSVCPEVAGAPAPAYT